MTTCLIVDDVEVTRFTTKEILEDLGVNSVVANDGNSAMQALQTSSVDVVLLDWHIGKESGLELLKTIRGRYGQIPVVMFSGVEGEAKANEAVGAGASAFLTKPTTKDKLSNCFKTIGLQVA